MLSSHFARRSIRLLSQPARVCCWASTLIVADPGHVAPSCAAVTAVQQLNADDTIDLVLVGTEAPRQVPTGITTVLFYKSLTTPTAETVAACIADAAAAGYDRVVGTSTKFGSTVIPRVAALLQASPVTDITAVIDAATEIGRAHV